MSRENLSSSRLVQTSLIRRSRGRVKSSSCNPTVDMIALEQSSDRAEIYAAASTNQVEESMQALSRVSSRHAHAQCALYMHLYMLCCFGSQH